jgi:hypothetical protein
MSRHEPKVYIIVLNYRNWEDVKECLGSLFRSIYPNYSIIVVDNFSGNRSLEQLMDWADQQSIRFRYFDRQEWTGATAIPDTLPRLSFVQNDSNEGFASGNNLAIRQLLSADTYIWLLNPDMVVKENTLGELVGFAGAHPFKSIVGAVVRYYRQPDKVHVYGGGSVNFRSATVRLATIQKDIPSIGYISGGSLFAHSAHFREIGLLPEDYFLYWEETDWCYQAARQGYSMLVCPTAVCFDKISTTIGKSFLADFYYTRNGLFFVRKMTGSLRPSVYVFVFFRLLKRLVSGRWRRAGGVIKGTLAFIKEKRP